MAHLAKAGRVRSALYFMLWKPVIVSSSSISLVKIKYMLDCSSSVGRSLQEKVVEIAQKTDFASLFYVIYYT